MPTYTDPVIINGSTNASQLVVKGTVGQNVPLQEWRKDTTTPTLQAQVTHDGRLQIGTFSSGTMDTDDALIEAHRADTDTSKPKRGLHLMGAISGTLNEIVSWVVQELTLKGSSGISALHTALRVRLRNEATGTMTNSDLRGGDIEVVNAGGTSVVPVATLTGLRVAVDQQGSASATNIYGLKVEMTGTPNAYAVHTTGGTVRFGYMAAGLVRSDVSGNLSSAPLTGTDISNNSIPLNKLVNGTAYKLLGYNSSGVVAEVDAPSSGASLPLVVSNVMALNSNSQYFSRRLRLSAAGKVKLTATTLLKGV